MSAIHAVVPGSSRFFARRLWSVVATIVLAAALIPAVVSNAGAVDRIQGAVALYDFTDGAGATVADSSGFGTPLNLAIANPGNTTWGPGGLTLDAATTIQSSGNATKITSAVQSSGAVTVELWIEPSNITQDGPARIFSLSQSSTKRDLTVGQGRWGSQPKTVYDTRLRTTATSTNGTPALTTPQNTTTTDLQHVVFTRTPAGVTTTYVDGVAVATGSAGGTLGNWAAMPLLLGNEIGGGRPWLGRYCLAAVYSTALTAGEVDQNFDAGCLTENVAPTANDDSATVVQNNFTQIDLIANDVDSDGSVDPDSVTIVDQPAQGTVTVAGGGQVTYTSTGALGDDTFTYTVEDDEGAVSNAATVTVSVRAENEPPVLDPIGNQTGAEGDDVAIAVSATDPNGDPLTFSASGLPQELNIDAQTGAITGALSQTSAGTWTVEVTADDGLGGTDDESFTFTVDPVNVAPAIVPIGDQQVATGPFELQVVATDADGDGITFSATGLPDDLTIDSSSGLITGTASTAGTSIVTITASDPTDGVSTAEFSLSILAVDVSPVVEYRFDDAAGTTVADSSGNGPPLDLSIANPGNTTWLPNGLQVDAATTISSGSPATKVIDAVSGTGELTVDLYIEAGLVQQFGPARILSISNSSTTRNVTIGQGGGRSRDPQTTLDVRLRSTTTSINGVPSLTSPTGTVNGDPQHVTFTRDAAGATTITVDGTVIATGTAGGSLANWASTMPLILGNEAESNRPWLGTYCYAAIYDQIHTQAELALRQDGCTATDDNASPVVDAIGDQTNDPGDTVSLTATGSDADGDPIVFSATGLPTGVSIDSAGLISGTIAPDAGGIYSPTVTATDPDGATGTTTFTWTVTVPNVPPTANDDDASVVSGGSIEIPVADNDSDSDGTLDLGSVEIVTMPTAGDAVPTPSGAITYTSTGGAGSDTFTYRISDDDGDASNEATVTVTVLAENSPPTIEPIDDQTNDEGQSVALGIVASDPDGNDLTYSVTTELPAALNIDAESGTISGDLSQTSAGVYSVEVTVDDGVGGTATKTFTWTVNVVDVAPVVDPIADQEGRVGDTVSVTATGSDEDGDTLEFAAAGLPDALAIDVATGIISGEITAAPGVYPVTVTATDPGGNFGEATFNFTVLDAAPRVDGALALYEFLEGSGTTVADTSGSGTPLDLTIADTADVSWAPGALTLDASTTLASAGPATKITDAVAASGELTVEAWIAPDNTTQSGPARIVSISESPFARDVTLGQGTFGSAPTDTFDLRLRSTTVGTNGSPSTTTPAGAATTDLTHVVATRAADGSTTIYVDGQVAQTSTVGGNLSNWTAMPLLLGNEATGDRPWLGTFCLTAVYDTALSASEVGQNFEAGCEIGSNASALVTINNGDNNIEASTFAAGSFDVINTSTAGVQIQSVSLDLSTSIYNDVVFDPDGDAGDVGSKCFEPNAAQAAATGLQEPNGGSPPNCDNSMFAGPHEGGYDVLNLTFDDFDADENLTFSVDNDPTSIQGVPITGNSGSISGLELIGSTVTITFADLSGTVTTMTGRLFAQDSGDANGVNDAASQLILDQSTPVPGALDLAVDGVTLNPTGFSSGATAAVVPDAAQQVTLSGPADADVRLLVVESSYDEPEGFDREPFEANRADVVAVYDATLDGTGTASIAVTLPNADTTHDANNGDLYQLIAAVSDTPQYAGASNIVILELDPTAGPASPVIAPIGTVNLVVDEAGQVPVSATDANSDPITLSFASSPDIAALGATFTQPVAGVGDAVLEWTPAATDVGTYQVTITASDPTASPDATSTFTLNVVTEAISGGTADVAIAPGGGIDASTFNGGFNVTNTSTGGQTIASVTFDLSSAVLPDMVFDPVGQAGDATAKCLIPSSGAAATGYVVPADECVDPFTQPHNGTDGDEGFDAATAAFSDFGAGETFSFAVDVDPTSIKDVPGAGNAGSVSGLELAGSTVTVAFSDGSVAVQTFRTGSSLADSSVSASSVARDTVALAVDGVTLAPQPDLSDAHSAAAVGSETQTIIVTGPANAAVRLLRLESALVQTPSYDPDPFEANKIVAVETIDVTLDAAGTASVPVTLTDTVTGGVATDDTGLNYFTAVIGTGTNTGALSNHVVLDLDPTVGGPPVAVDDLTSASPGDSVAIDVLDNDTSDVGLDPSSVTVTSGPIGGTVVGPDANGALTYNAEQGFDDNDGDSFTYTVADTDGQVSNQATVTITDDTAVAEVVYRINAGGAEYVDLAGNTWSADTGFTNGTVFPTGGPKTGQAIAGTDDDLLYQSERFGGPPNDPPLAYDLAVTNGVYEVDLLLAEIYIGSTVAPSGPATLQRVFSAFAEGQAVFTDLDLHATDGVGVARTETITVSVTDAVLDIDLTATLDNAKVSAIEVRRVGDVADQAPTIDPIDDVTVAEGQTADVAITSSEPDGDPVSLAVAGTPDISGFASFTDTGDGTGTLSLTPATGDADSYQVTVTATDDDGSDSQTFTLTVTEPLTGGQVIARINSGGPQVAAIDGGPAWEADASPGHPFLSDAGSDGNAGFPAVEPGQTVPPTTPGEIFDTERWSDSGFAYSIPVPAGTQVYVRLFAGNGFGGTGEPGARVYDVLIDGQVVTDDLDLVTEFGNEIGGMIEYLVTSDGAIDLSFTGEEENPLANGIEVLSAASQPGVLGVAPTALNFGPVLPNSTSVRTVTLSNLGFEAGDPTITVTDLTAAGGEFSADLPGGGIAVAPGGTATVDVTFAPTAVGAQSGTLTITHDGTNSPETVTLDGAGVSDIPVSFSASGLSGESLNNPTSLEFGPDDRLYASQQNGTIYAYTVERNGPNDYDVTDTETINLVQQITNHNDDGSVNNGVNTRQVTGLMTAGTAANPILYVTSSDPRIGAGGGGNDSGLDTNSGVVSKLTWTGTEWDHVQLVRGLPRSEENHATNGLDLDPATNTLFVAQGGHANKGAPSNNFAGTSEYYLSGTILALDLDALNALPIQTDAQGQDYAYDLPTLDDPTRNDAASDPFGGNNGLNMAVPEPGGPVQVHSPGYRNQYDVVWTASGELYTSDNGPNTNWGGQPLIYDSNGTLLGHEGDAGVDFDAAAGDYCTNEFNEGGSSGHGDPLFHVTGEGFYGGHPAPIRAFPGLAGVYVYEKIGGNWVETELHNFGDLLPAGLTLADFPDNPIECDYQANDSGLYLDIINSSTNGIAEYTASNFGGAMQGNLLTASFNGNINRYEMNGAGTDVVASEQLFSGFGSTPLDVTTIDNNGPFPGTVWAATYGADNITVFEPADYDGNTGGNCTGADDPALDEDNDGFDNADEIAAGTDPCSGGSQPTDFDEDGTSDVTDADDDNDGIDDTVDPFAIDATNGIGSTLPILYPLENENPGTGFFGLGFTGLMTNGTDTWIDQFDEDNMAAGGAVGALTVEDVPPGDAYTGTNTQQYAFQFGVDVDQNTDPFVVHTQVEAPFFTSGGNTETPANYESNGLFIGTGGQDDYLKVVFGGNGGPVTQVLLETGGTVDTDVKYDTTVTGDFLTATAVDLYLEVDPAAGTVQPRVSIDDGATVTDLGAPVAIPAAWLDGADALGLAVGIISTSNGGAPFAATWDFVDIDFVQGPTNTPPTIDPIADAAVAEGDPFVLDVVAGDADGDPLTYALSGAVPTGMAVDGAGQITYTPDLDDSGTYPVTVEVDDGINPATTEDFLLSVTQTDTGTVLARINVGGPAVTSIDGGPDWTANLNPNGLAELVAGGDNVFASSSGAGVQVTNIGHPSVPTGTPLDVFQTERWDAAAAPEMAWNFPVNAGDTIEVRIGQGEIYNGVTAAGQRAYNLMIDGVLVEQNIDPFGTVGSAAGFVTDYIVTADGDGLDIEFIHLLDNPNPKSFEIIQVSATNAAPTLTADDDAPTVTEGDTAVVTVSADDTDGDSVALSAPTLPGFASFDAGTGELSLSPVAGDAAGSPYVIAVDGDDGNGGTDSIDITVTVTEPTAVAEPLDVVAWALGDALYRVNAGGPELPASDGGVPWGGDQVAPAPQSPQLDPAYAAQGNAEKKSYSSSDTIMLHPSVPSDSPAAMFGTERYDPATGLEMGYDFDVPVGTLVEVRLYFAELFQTGTPAIPRIFDVQIDGQTVAADINQLAAPPYGHDVGFMLPFVVDSDGTIDVDFIHVSENPAIKGIEIIELVTAADAAPNSDVGFLTTLTNPGSNNVDATLSAVGVSVDGAPPSDVLGSCDTGVLAPGATAECRFASTVTGSDSDVIEHVVFATADFDGGPAGEQSVSNAVDITLVETPLEDVRINAGGPTVAATDGGPDWQADQSPPNAALTVASGSSLGAFSIPTMHSSVPAYAPTDLYQTERWDGTNGAAPDDMTYAIPVAVGGSATVNLFMANGWPGASAEGAREFDVYIEGNLVLDEFDLSKTYGHATGGMETFAVTDGDADGLITIIFEHGTGPQNPLVNAIEVIPG